MGAALKVLSSAYLETHVLKKVVISVYIIRKYGLCRREKEWHCIPLPSLLRAVIWCVSRRDQNVFSSCLLNILLTFNVSNSIVSTGGGKHVLDPS